MGGLEGPEGAQQESSVPEEDKFEGQLVPQVWMARDSESNLCIRNQGRFIWTPLYVRTGTHLHVISSMQLG